MGSREVLPKGGQCGIGERHAWPGDDDHRRILRHGRLLDREVKRPYFQVVLLQVRFQSVGAIEGELVVGGKTQFAVGLREVDHRLDLVVCKQGHFLEQLRLADERFLAALRREELARRDDRMPLLVRTGREQYRSQSTRSPVAHREFEFRVLRHEGDQVLLIRHRADEFDGELPARGILRRVEQLSDVANESIVPGVGKDGVRRHRRIQARQQLACRFAHGIEPACGGIEPVGHPHREHHVHHNQTDDQKQDGEAEVGAVDESANGGIVPLLGAGRLNGQEDQPRPHDDDQERNQHPSRLARLAAVEPADQALAPPVEEDKPHENCHRPEGGAGRKYRNPCLTSLLALIHGLRAGKQPPRHRGDCEKRGQAADQSDAVIAALEVRGFGRLWRFGLFRLEGVLGQRLVCGLLRSRGARNALMAINPDSARNTTERMMSAVAALCRCVRMYSTSGAPTFGADVGFGGVGSMVVLPGDRPARAGGSKLDARRGPGAPSPLINSTSAFPAP